MEANSSDKLLSRCDTAERVLPKCPRPPLFLGRTGNSQEDCVSLLYTHQCHRTSYFHLKKQRTNIKLLGSDTMSYGEKQDIYYNLSNMEWFRLSLFALKLLI